MITLIAAIGEMNEIGHKNSLLWSIPSDMAHFKNYTIGKPVVMVVKHSRVSGQDHCQAVSTLL